MCDLIMCESSRLTTRQEEWHVLVTNCVRHCYCNAYVEVLVPPNATVFGDGVLELITLK